MSRAENRILCEMCRAQYPPIGEIIRYAKEHPLAAKTKDWFGLSPLHYLAMNKHVDHNDLREIFEKAPVIKAEFA